MKRRVGNYVIVSHFSFCVVLAHHRCIIPEDDEDDGLSTRSSPSFIDIQLLCGNYPYRLIGALPVRIRIRVPSSIIHTVAPLSINWQPSLSSPVLVDSELRPLPSKVPFLFQNRRRFVHQEDHKWEMGVRRAIMQGNKQHV
jgi:hypothetical protein